MKCQSLFSGKNKEKSKCRLLKFYTACRALKLSYYFLTASSESIGAVAQRNALRPKREVGWGEVVVIIIVIIILL